MLVGLILVAVQPDATALTAARELQTTVATTSVVSDQGFDCMESKSKAQLIAQIESGTSESIVTRALQECVSFKTAYARAATNTYIPPSKANELAEGWFVQLRSTFVEQVEKWLNVPQVAETRTAVATSNWRSCVTGKARDWSRLPDEANSVATAAVTSCASFETPLRNAMAAEFRIKKLPIGRVSDVLASSRSTMNDVAVEAVISERAKKLPRK